MKTVAKDLRPLCESLYLHDFRLYSNIFTFAVRLKFPVIVLEEFLILTKFKRIDQFSIPFSLKTSENLLCSNHFRGYKT